MGDASQHFLNYIEAAVHNCPAVRDVSSVIAYKDTKNKQNKTEERADKLGFVQIFVSPFLHRFRFFSSFPLFHLLLHMSATALKKRLFCN